MDNNRFIATSAFVAAATAMAVVPATGVAEPVTVDVFTTVRFSDNIAQSSDDNAESGIEYRPGISINHIKDPGRCNSRLGSEFAYQIYQGGDLDDEISANLNWNGDCRISPYLVWRASDRLSESRQDNRGTNTVANRERKNVFSTGPQFILPLGDLTSLITSVEWRKSDFEEDTDNNSERWVGNARLQRNFSPVMQGWLSTSYSETEFDRGEDLQTTSYRVGMSRQVSRTVFSGDFGISKLERESEFGEDEAEGAVWNVSATHSLDNGRVYTSLSRDFTDISDDVVFAFGDIRFNFTQTQAVELTTFTTGADFQLENGYGVKGSVYAQEYEYIGSDVLEQILGAEFGVTKSLSSRLSLNGGVRYERLDFEPSGGVGDEYGASLGMLYQRTQDLRFGVIVGHETQDGDDAVIAEYSENWVAATVTYNLR